jgi:hypothetical protein
MDESGQVLQMSGLALIGAGSVRRLQLARVAAQEPVWPWVYAFDEIKLAGYRAEIAARLGRWDTANRPTRSPTGFRAHPSSPPSRELIEPQPWPPPVT